MIACWVARGRPEVARRASGWSRCRPPPWKRSGRHLAAFVDDFPEALIFTGEKGGVLRSSSFGSAVRWRATVARLGLPEFHFHDLRHTGNTLAASSGASTRELMHRMGHSTMRAALIYQHATSERDREIASAMDRRIAKQSGKKAAKGKKGGGRKKKDERPER